MSLPYTQPWFPYTCFCKSNRLVAGAMHTTTLRGMFLLFPLLRVSGPEILITVKWGGTPPCPFPLCLTMAPVSRHPLPEPDTISRYHAISKRAPKLAAGKILPLWRRKSRKPKRVLTAGDRVVQARKREQHRHDYQAALEQGQAAIRELAEGLRNRFGKYGVDHYFNDLIHRAHKSRSERKVSRWNAYQKLELERMKCKSSMISIANPITCTPRRSWRQRVPTQPHGGQQTDQSKVEDPHPCPTRGSHRRVSTKNRRRT